ncbi:MAG: PP2C family protein-serine/threonine phosphatase [Terriglobales bacterium]
MNSRQRAPERSGHPQAMPHPSLDVEFAQLSDTGRVRDHNEDYLGHFIPTTPMQVRSHGWLFVLADGVGGQDKGEVASRMAVERVIAGFREAPGEERHSSLLPRLVKEANVEVYEAGMKTGTGQAAMASTFVACALRFDRASIAHVGDSRCYLVRRAHATLLTRDHTIAGEQTRMGLLTTEEACESPTRHVLSRSIGGEAFVNVETGECPVMIGDTLVLCSDGLHGAVSPPEIATIATHAADLESAAHRLVAAANQKDGSDNISVQLIRVRSVERVGMYRGRSYRLR